MTKTKENQWKIMPAALTLLRIFVGWHFLYEGIIKLASDNWSSYSYLAQSRWLLSEFFHWIILTPAALAATDFLNMWGLVFIGLALFLGVLTRPAALSGALLLLLYYVAVPPFIVPTAGGYFFIVNNQLIESFVLVMFAILPANYTWGMDRLLKIIQLRRKEKKFPQEANHEFHTPAQHPRREFIKNLAVLPVFGGALFGMAKKAGWLSFEEESLKRADAISSASVINREMYDLNLLKGKVPSGKIKGLEISRLIPGGNLIAGFAHARDLVYVSKWIKHYHSDEKVIETLWRYEDVGIKNVILRTDAQTIRILKEYWRRGGKIQWLAQTYPDKDDLTGVKNAIDNGAVAAFVMGNIADKLVYNNQLEYLYKPVEYIRSQGIPAGVAAHAINTPKTCLANGIEPDFFMKTLHHDKYWSAHPAENRNEYIVNESSSMDHNRQHDNIWCVDAEETAEFFKTCPIPWIAYKVLAAGAILPEDGFNYAFKNGADFICVGMFDFQVIDNANTVYTALNGDFSRQRKWYG